MNMNEFAFDVERKKIIIGTRKYPVRDIRGAKIFRNSNTDEPTLINVELVNALDKDRFEMGRCYSNTQKVVENGRERGLEIEFYSGWMIIADEAIHHAWNVFEGDIIDVSQSHSYFNLMRRLKSIQSMTHAEVADLYIETQSRRPRTSRDCIWGKVPEEIIYIGCPDSKENAIGTFNKLMEKFPHHPMRKKMLASGKTALQEEVFRRM